jgi:N-acetylmuramoyl-L-alanine amidase
MTLTNVKYLIVHCSGTPPEDTTVDALYLNTIHKGFGLSKIGHHLVIKQSGDIQRGRNEDEIGQHTPGFDTNSLSVCLIGGLHRTESITRSGRTIRKAWPDYSTEQLASLKIIIDSWKTRWPQAKLVGHGDLNKKKSCPGFDVDRWYDTGEIIPSIKMAYPLGVIPGEAVT